MKIKLILTSDELVSGGIKDGVKFLLVLIMEKKKRGVVEVLKLG